MEVGGTESVRILRAERDGENVVIPLEFVTSHVQIAFQRVKIEVVVAETPHAVVGETAQKKKIKINYQYQSLERIHERKDLTCKRAIERLINRARKRMRSHTDSLHRHRQ